MDEPEPDFFVEAGLLLLLREKAGTRTALAHRMRAFGVAQARVVEPVLCSMERAGLIRSAWHPFSVASPPWRCYYITRRGVSRLARYAGTLRATHGAMHALRDEWTD